MKACICTKNPQVKQKISTFPKKFKFGNTTDFFLDIFSRMLVFTFLSTLLHLTVSHCNFYNSVGAYTLKFLFLQLVNFYNSVGDMVRVSFYLKGFLLYLESQKNKSSWTLNATRS